MSLSDHGTPLNLQLSFPSGPNFGLNSQGRSAPMSGEGRAKSSMAEETQSRRLATIVALDVAGYSARTEADESRTAAEIPKLRETIDRTTRTHAGRIFNTAGDGFMLEFPSSSAGVEAAFALAEQCEPRVRIGVHLGDVVVQPNGDLLGHGVNVAARLMAQSQPGSALVSAAVRQTLRGPIVERLISRGPLKLDKMNETIEAFALVPGALTAGTVAIVQPRPAPGPPAKAPDSPCVGRARELERLTAQIEKAKNGESGLLIFSGEAGVGKTRMTLEADRIGRANHFLVTRGHSTDSESSLPYQPLIEQLEYSLRVAGSVAFRQTMGENAAEVSKLMPELRQIYSDIPPYPTLPPEQERRYLLHGVAEFLARSAAIQPLMMIFEDLHSADESTCILVQYLAERLKTEPVLLIGTYRDSELTSTKPFSRALQKFMRERLGEDVRLGRLKREEIHEWLNRQFGLEPPASLVELIFSETEGNPFFIEEVIGLLKDSGKLLTDDGRFRSDTAIADTEVTRGVRLIIEDRVSRSSPLAREIMTFAAVAGRAFEFDLLTKLDAKRAEDDVLNAIEEAVANRLIEDISKGRIVQYRFVHEQIRQALLSGLSGPRRQRLHLRVADALEAAHPGAIGKYAGEIGHHLYQAGSTADPTRTAKHLITAAERAIDALAFEDALRTLDLVLGVLEEDDQPEAKARVQGLRARALVGSERIPESLEALKLAIALAPSDEMKDEFLLQRSQMLLDLWRGSEAIDDLERLLSRARESGDAKQELKLLHPVARAYYVMSLDHMGFADKAREAYERTIALAREQKDQQSLGSALMLTANLIDYWPDYRSQVIANLAEAAKIAKATKNEGLEFDVLTARLGVDRVESTPGEVDETVRRLIARRDPVRLNAYYFRMMWMTLNLGWLEKCVEICNAGIALAYRIGALPVQYPTIKAMALIELGRLSEAWASLDEEIADEAHRFGAALRDLGRLQYELALGARDSVLERAPRVIAEAHALKRAWMLAWIARTLALSAPDIAGDETKLGAIEALIASTGALPGALGHAALSLAHGAYEESRAGIAQGRAREEFSLAVVFDVVANELESRVNAAEKLWVAARVALSAAIAGARRSNMRFRLAKLLAQLARIEAAAGDETAAKTAMGESMVLQAEIAATILDPAHRASFAQSAGRLGAA